MKNFFCSFGIHKWTDFVKCRETSEGGDVFERVCCKCNLHQEKSEKNSIVFGFFPRASLYSYWNSKIIKMGDNKCSHDWERVRKRKGLYDFFNNINTYGKCSKCKQEEKWRCVY